MKLTARAPKSTALSERHLEVLASEYALPDFEADHIGQQCHREHECRSDRSLGGQYQASRGGGGESGPDHARHVLGRDGPYAKCRKQHGADEDDTEQRTGCWVEDLALLDRHGGPRMDLGDTEDGSQDNGYDHGHDNRPPCRG
jgi:hypothetical protein